TVEHPLIHDNQKKQRYLVEQSRHSINGDRLQRRISKDEFLVTRSGRVAFVSGIDVRPKHATHRWQLLEKITQDFFGFCFCCFVWRDFAEASANFCSEPRVQMSHANARSVG